MSTTPLTLDPEHSGALAVRMLALLLLPVLLLPAAALAQNSPSIPIDPSWLVQWGPAAAVLVLMAVAESKLRRRWDSSKGPDRKLCAWLYIGNWIFIAVLLSVVSFVWVADRNRENVSLSGRVMDLRPPLKINDSAKVLFTRTRLKNGWLYDVEWHYVEPDALEHLEIRLENKTDFHDYRIPLNVVGDRRNVELKYRSGKLWLKTQGRNIELEPVHSASMELEAPPVPAAKVGFVWFPEAVAGPPVDSELIRDALRADDSYVRQSATQYLADNVKEMRAFMEAALLDEDTSDLVRAGIITALARASSPDLRATDAPLVSETAERAIFKAMFNDDEVIAAQSRRFVVRNVEPRHLEWLSHLCAKNGGVLTDSRERYCQFLKLNLVYNAAISLWQDSITAPPAEAIQTTRRALRLITQGDDLFETTLGPERTQLAKLLYGKALLSYELARAYSRAGESAKASAVTEQTVEWFTRMLRYLERSDGESYEYPHHVAQAACYVRDPRPGCFEEHSPRAVATDHLVNPGP